MTEVELDKLSEAILRRLEPLIRKEIIASIEEATTTCLKHLGHEMQIFASMRKQGDI